MLKKFVLGQLQTNCYMMINDKKEAFIVDPGDNGQKIRHYLTENGLELTAILLTHGHFDHIGAVDYLYDLYHCPIYAHKETIEIAEDPFLNLSTMSSPMVLSAPITPVDGNMEINGYQIEWLFLPGHCKGSSMIRVLNENIIFSGDVLFKGSIGRFDFPTSSRHDTKQSLKYIKELDYDAVVYPGHGEDTTLNNEKLYNPYLRK